MVLAKANEHGVIPCIHNGAPEMALKRIARGFRLVTVGSDARLMTAGAQQIMSKMRSGMKPAAGSTY